MVWVTSDGIEELSCDRLPASGERLQVIGIGNYAWLMKIINSLLKDLNLKISM